MKDNLLIFITLSIIIHIALINVSIPLSKKDDENLFLKKDEISKITIDNIHLRPFKTVGKINGKKNLFVPLLKPLPPSSQIERITKEKSVRKVVSKGKSYSMNMEEVLPATNLPKSPFPQNSAINIRIDVPEGVDLDQLNPLELKFYIFNKRHFESFGIALYKSYLNFLSERPHLNFINLGKQTSMAKVIFYPNGRIDELQILEMAEDTNFQHFFQETIEGILLPNPPKELLIDGKFHVYYSLLLNH